MKKFFKAAAIVLCAALTFAVLIGCGGSGKALHGTMTFVIDDKAGTVKTVEAELDGFTDADSVMDVVEKLAEDKVLCYSGTKGVYGVMLTGFGVIEDGTDLEGNPAKVDNYILKEDQSAGKYLYIYTNVEKDKNDYEGMTTVEYDGQTLAESINGISSMSVEDGAVIYITYIVYV